MTRAWSPTILIPWFSKTEGYAALLHHPFLFKGKPTHAQEVAIGHMSIGEDAKGDGVVVDRLLVLSC